MKRFRMPVRVAGAALVSAFALSMTGCANPVATVQRTLATPSVATALEQLRSSHASQIASSALKKAGTLTVGLNTNSSAPMALSAQDGTAQGFDVDVAYALADNLGLSVEFVSVDNASSAGVTCDVVMGASTSGSDASPVGSYAQSATAFFGKASTVASAAAGTTGAATSTTATSASASSNVTTARLTTAALAGKTVGVQEGSASQQLLERSNIDAEQKTFSNLNEAFEALAAGTVDYVLCSATTGAYLSGAYTDLACLGTIDVPQAVGVALGTSSQEVQRAVSTSINDLVSTGVIDVIRGKWMAGLGEINATSQIAGVTLSSAVVDAPAEATETGEGVSGIQDGSTAGSNAVDIYG